MRGSGSAADSGAVRAACRLRASPPGAARLLGAGRQVEREQQVLRRRQRGGEREAEGGALPAPRLKTSLTSGKALAEHAAPSEGRLKAAGARLAPSPAAGLWLAAPASRRRLCRGVGRDPLPAVRGAVRAAERRRFAFQVCQPAAGFPSTCRGFFFFFF